MCDQSKREPLSLRSPLSSLGTYGSSVRSLAIHNSAFEVVSPGTGTARHCLRAASSSVCVCVVQKLNSNRASVAKGVNQGKERSMKSVGRASSEIMSSGRSGSASS